MTELAAARQPGSAEFVSPRPTAPAVELVGLCKRFPVRRTWRDIARHPFTVERATVVDNVTCTIERGEFFGLVGPNGAGKTTLFKILATLLLPDTGSATVLGHDIVRDPSSVRRLLTPVVADERSLYWRLSARENLALYARLYGLPQPVGRRRVSELLEVVGLADTAEKMVGAFSSGMRQRLLIARALLASPRVLLLDEPTRSLDPLSARQLRAFLRDEVSVRQGCTVILATHNAEEALELCGRVAILDRGRLLAVGRADDLMREVGAERYQLCARTAAERLMAVLAANGVTAVASNARRDVDGWTTLELTIADGPAGASRVVAALVHDGIAVARLERIARSLADLIAGIVQQCRRDADA